MGYFRLKTEVEKPFTPDEKPVKLDKKDRPSGKPFMKGMSDKRAAETEQYNQEAKEFVKGKMCAVFPKKKATQVHHKKGRIAGLLLNKKYWLPVSMSGHEKIEKNPNWAKEMGFSMSRLSKD